MTLLDNPTGRRPLVVLSTQLPGPDRRRSPQEYHYRLTYRNPQADATGCVMIWEVSGGRHSYQLALERDSLGDLRCHCTCADAVFRTALEPDHLCKHVRGLVELVRMLGDTFGGGELHPKTAPLVARRWQATPTPN
jgi:hypothetical protein